jgi:uncharacterized protein YchJ
MLRRTGPFDQNNRDVFEVEYTDDQKVMVMISNFVWIHDQWVFIDISWK